MQISRIGICLKRFGLAASMVSILVVAACGDAQTPTATKPSPGTQPTATVSPTNRSSTATAGPKSGGTLRIVPSGSLSSIDIQNSTSQPVQNIRWHVAEGLFQTDQQTAVQPMLVDNWSTSSDSLTWRFTLRKVTFQNGAPATAQDVVGSFARVQDNLGTWNLLRKNFGATMQAEGDNVVVVQVSKPTGLVIDGLQMEQNYPAPIVPKQFYSTDLKQTSTALPIGTGPYKFVSWAPGDRWMAERWADYKPRSQPGSNLAGGHVAYIDQLVFIEIPDTATAVAALKTGQVDVLDQFSPDFAKEVKAVSKLNLFQAQPGNATQVTVNNAAAPFKDVRARLAVQLAFPADKALTAVAGDPQNWRLCPIQLGCGTKWDTAQARADAAQYYNKQDLAQAQALVKSAGLVGTKVRILQPTDVATMSNLAVITKEVLTQIGFDAQLVALDWATQTTRRTDPTQWEVFFTWIGSARTSGPLLRTEFQKAGWHNQYQDSTGKMEQLFSQFMTAQTNDEQIKKWEQISKFISDDAVRPMIGEYFSPVASTTALKGWNPNPYPVYFNAWLER